MHLLGMARLAFLSLATTAALGFAVLVANGGLSGSAATASAAAQEPKTVTVLVGGGQDTVDLLSFFPRKVRIHVGDTITWKQNSDAAHTVSLHGAFPGPGGANLFFDPGTTVPGANLPVPGRPGVTQLNPLQVYPFPGPEVLDSVYSGGQFVSSGRFVGTPPTPGLDRDVFEFSLTFDTPGTYEYLCLTHVGTMFGTVEVVGATSDVPTAADIEVEGQAQIAALTNLTEREKAQRDNSRSEPGPAGNTTWYVMAGNHFFQLGDLRATLLEFLPRDVTVTAGDTIVWGSTGFHSVTFNPAPPPPPLNLLETLPDGTQAIINNPLAYDPVKPSAVYDPTKLFNSGNLAQAQPNGTAWTLAFETPGVFEYYCAVHREAGMVGTITVLPR